MTKSWLRGHPIIWINEKGVYEDDKSDIPVNDEDTRPCASCGVKYGMGIQADPCLGILPGVDSACCGHGIKENAYIRFINGVVITGFEVDELTR